MVAADAWQVVEAVVVAGGGRVPPPCLEQADRVGVHRPPRAALGGVAVDEVGQALVRLGVRHRDVARKQVEQRRDVGGTLDRGVAAQQNALVRSRPELSAKVRATCSSNAGGTPQTSSTISGV